MQHDPTIRKLCNSVEAAAILHVEPPTIWRYVQAKRLTPVGTVGPRNYLIFDREYVESMTDKLPLRKRSKKAA
jgi:hypothetical protein